jgi:K+-transporting ATPase KdpF subunit
MAANGFESRGNFFGGTDARSEGNTAMMFDYALAGLVSAGLLFYLTYALLRPERF